MKHYFTKFEETVRNDWDKPALSDLKGESFTFGSLAVEIEKIHTLFNAIGIGRGDKVAICSKNSARWAVAYLASTTYHCTVVPILRDFTHEATGNLVNHSESRVLFTDSDVADYLKTIDTPRIEVIFDTAGFKPLFCRTPEIREAIEAAQSGAAVTPEKVHYDPLDNEQDIAVINYTSGTTSAPKGVMLRHEGFTSMVEFSQKHVKAHSGMTLVSMLPMAHMYGLMFELIYPLVSGVHITYLGRTPSPSLLLNTMKSVKPYMIVTVPLVMEKIYRSSLKPVLDKPAVKVITKIPGLRRIVYYKMRKGLVEAFGGRIGHFIMGGAALSPEVEKCFRTIRLPYTIGYGMTEASPLLAYEDWYRFRRGTCGKPVDRVSVKIDSEDPRTIAGEILAKGPSICVGYWRNPEATAASFTEDGWFRTGDLGLMDKDGNITIKGRCKTMILSANGQNIYPEEIEAVINSHPGVVESVVVDRSCKLVALVCMDPDTSGEDVRNEDKRKSVAELIRNTVNQKLPKYSQLSRIELRLEPFEKTPKMSIKRYLYA